MDRICETFENDYQSLYQIILKEYEEETGEKIKPYKDYEPDLLVTFCEKYLDDKDILNQAAKLLSGLIILQALPNANHRTAFRFVSIYLLITTDEKMITYNEARDLYDGFYRRSKPILEFSKALIKKIFPAQSGIVEAVPFHRFISSLNHSS